MTEKIDFESQKLAIFDPGLFRSLDLERVLIYQKFFLWKSAIFHSIKLPFVAKADEKFLNVI